MRFKRIMAAALLAATCMMFAACDLTPSKKNNDDDPQGGDDPQEEFAVGFAVTKAQWNSAMRYFGNTLGPYTVTMSGVMKMNVAPAAGEPYGYERSVKKQYELNDGSGHFTSKGKVTYVGDGEEHFGGVSAPDEERYYDKKADPAEWYSKDRDGEWWKESSGEDFFTVDMLGMLSVDYDDYEYDAERKAYVGQFPYEVSGTDGTTVDCLIRFDYNGELKGGEWSFAYTVSKPEGEATFEAKMTWSVTYSAAEIVLPEVQVRLDGFYKFYSVVFHAFDDSVSYVGEEFMGLTFTEDFCTVDLRADGTCTMIAMQNITEGTWKVVSGTTIEIAANGATQTAYCDGETLTMDNGVNFFTLKKAH